MAAIFPTSRIYKLTPDLELLIVFDHEGEGETELLHPLDLANSTRTVDFLGFDNLIACEAWSENSGGQRYAIGVESSVTEYMVNPYSVTITYTSSEPHNLHYVASRSVSGQWEAVDSAYYGTRLAGTSTFFWEVPEHLRGISNTYEFALVTFSTYSPLDVEGSTSLSDTLTIIEALGNQTPVITENIALTGFGCNELCAIWNEESSIAVSAVDYDSPGNLTYHWSTGTSSPATKFRNPTSGAWVTELSGPWNEVDFFVESPSPGGRILAPNQAEFVVDVEDGGGGITTTSRTIVLAGIDGCTECSGLMCDCSCHGDIDCNGQIDAVDLNLLIQIIYFNAESPVDDNCPHVGRADFNCNGIVDGVDLNALINFAFFVGSGPCDPCEN
ncbi:MAG: hypothetical protein Kow0074_17790 [Candidatus Zixiibacteriota bacterium]